jgi:hypothetical protein
MNVRAVVGKLFFASSLLAVATHGSASLPNRTDLVALGCEPNKETSPLSPTHTSFRVSSRKRYVFLNPQADGFGKLCMDEIDTPVENATTCTTQVYSDLVKVSPVNDIDFGFETVTIFRSDASMELKRYGYASESYSCTPAKDPIAVLDYVINRKHSQKSNNAF